MTATETADLQLTIRTSGLKTLKWGKLRLQLYWPNFTARLGTQSELFLGLDTTVRAVLDRRQGLYMGIGINVVGFGLGIDYCNPTDPVRSALVEQSK